MTKNEFKELVGWYYTWRETKHMSDSIRRLWIKSHEEPRGPAVKIWGNGKDLPDLSVRPRSNPRQSPKTGLKSWFKKVYQWLANR